MSSFKEISKDYFYMHHLDRESTRGGIEFSDRWCKFLLSEIDLVENIGILDYGCGAARLSNYLSKNLHSFSYFGFEHDGEFGRKNIGFAKNNLAHDPRIKFLGLTNEDQFFTALKECEYAIFGSVFTHLKMDYISKILKQFDGFFTNGGIMYATFFIGENERSDNLKIYNQDSFKHLYYTKQEIDSVITDAGYRFNISNETFDSNDGHLHSLISIFK